MPRSWSGAPLQRLFLIRATRFSRPCELPSPTPLSSSQAFTAYCGPHHTHRENPPPSGTFPPSSQPRTHTRTSRTHTISTLIPEHRSGTVLRRAVCSRRRLERESMPNLPVDRQPPKRKRIIAAPPQPPLFTPALAKRRSSSSEQQASRQAAQSANTGSAGSEQRDNRMEM